jgi:hypothetical protein
LVNTTAFFFILSQSPKERTAASAKVDFFSLALDFVDLNDWIVPVVDLDLVAYVINEGYHLNIY